MTFKDLKFEPHKVIPKSGIQATLEVKPQVFVSVIAGDGFYSTAKGTGVRGAVTDPKNVSSFEVGIIDENLPEDQQDLTNKDLVRFQRSINYHNKYLLSWDIK